MRLSRGLVLSRHHAPLMQFAMLHVTAERDDYSETAENWPTLAEGQFKLDAHAKRVCSERFSAL
jgi:hypothetical protein